MEYQLSFIQPTTPTLVDLCAQAYLDHVYFDLPVIDAATLSDYKRCGEGPFQQKSLEHYALIACGLPFLDSATLEHHDIPSRQYGLETAIANFETLQRQRQQTTSLASVRAHLLILHASLRLGRRQHDAKCTQWLQQALQSLTRLLRGKETSTDPDQGDSSCQRRRNKQLWWCCFVMEQSYFLHSCSARRQTPHLPIAFAMKPLRANRFFSTDMHIPPQERSGDLITEIWTGLQGAASFAETTQVWTRLSLLLRRSPASSQASGSRQFCDRGHLRHSDLFWKIHELADSLNIQPTLLQQDMLRNPQDAKLYVQEAKKVLLHCQILIMLYQLLSGSSTAQQDAHIWRVLLHDRIQQSLQSVLRVAADSLEERTSSLAVAAFCADDVFRTLMAAASLLTNGQRPDLSEDGLFPTMHTEHELRREVKQVLSLALEAHEVFWMETASSSSPTNDRDVPMLVADLEEAPTPALSDLDGLVDLHQILGVPPAVVFEDKKERFEFEQQNMLSDFEDMWNTPIRGPIQTENIDRM